MNMPGNCRTAIFICLLAIWSAVLLFSFAWLLLICSVAGQNGKVETMARRMVNLYGRGCMLIISPWVKITKENLHILHPPCIVAANHLSMLDLTCLPFLPENNLCLVIKSWPAEMPFMKLFIHKANYINIDKLGFMEGARRIDEEIRKKSVIIIFPEGSRSADGKLKRLRSGAFRLAIEKKLPIYPLQYIGTDSAFPKGQFTLYPARITMRLHDKILPPAASDEAHNDWTHKRLNYQVKACLQATV
jgi:1-acyl-sn-glycerol-3-phosphate acyltransferase